MRTPTLAILIAASLVSPAVVRAADALASAAAAYATGSTQIGTLFDNPAAKAIVEKHIPGLTADPQIAMARSMTLKDIQAFAGGQITDDQLAGIDADLAKLPTSK